MKYSHINEYFTKLYCINLDRRTDRYEEVQKEFLKIGANVERISGIDGKTQTDIPGLTLKERSCYGLTSTHYKIIKNAKINAYESILIFEDDVMFTDNFNEIFNEKIKFLPNDWDLFYLGGNHILHVDGFRLITGDQNFKVTKGNYKTLNYELCKTPCTWCAHAVAISHKMYDRILGEIEKNPVNCIDVALYFIQQEGCNTYSFLPSIAIQKGSFVILKVFLLIIAKTH